MSDTYTPGPWHVYAGENGKQYVLAGNSPASKADIIWAPTTSPDNAGNAQLIAAAPDLLAACEQFLRYADHGNHPALASYTKTAAGGKIRWAVAKAKGVQ